MTDSSAATVMPTPALSTTQALPSTPADERNALVKMVTLVLNPKTPAGHKIQGFFGGASFVYLLVYSGATPEQIRTILQTLMTFFIGT